MRVVTTVVGIALLGALGTLGCGRIAFDPVDPLAASDGGLDGPPDGTLSARPSVMLACGQTIALPGAAIAGSVVKAAITGRGLVALWLDGNGALRGSSWTAVAGAAVVERAAVPLDPGPFTELWIAGSDDQVFYAAQGAAGVTTRMLDAGLVETSAATPPQRLAPLGRNPITRLRGKPGFAMVSVATASPAPRVLVTGEIMAHALPALASHALPSIALDRDGYVVVTELADQYGPGCWLSRLDDGFALQAGPGSLESTQQADCDSSITSAGDGATPAAMAWMDRDPVSSYAAFRDTGGASGAASGVGEDNVGLPRVTATSTGPALLYRSPAGVRVFGGAAPRTLAPTTALADLVTWADQALVVWSTGSGAPQLTRICP